MKTDLQIEKKTPNQPKPRFLRNRWLFRLSLSFLATSIVLTGLLMLLVSRTVTGQFIDQTDAANRELLAQTAINIDYTLTDLYTEYYQLWQKDPAIQAVLQTTGSEIPRDLDQKLTQELHFSAEQLMLVRSAHFISYRLDRVWSSNAAPTSLAGQPDTSANRFLYEVAAQYDTYRKDIFFARKTRYTDAVPQGGTSAPEVDNLTFFFASRSTDTATRPFEDVLLINIDRDAFSQLIQQHTDTGFILLVSPSGEIVSDTSKQWTGQVLNDLVTNPDHFPRMRESVEPGGSFLAATAIGRSLVTWQKASSMNFYLIDVMPLVNVYAEVNLLNRKIVLYFMAAMLLSLLIGLLSVRYLYKPLQNLLDRIGSRSSSIDEFVVLDAAYQHFALREHQQILLQLLHGIPPETSLAMKSAYPVASLDFSNDQIASTIGLSNGYLRQLFKQETGQTLNDYIIESRIQRACELLVHTSQTGREIASATGFNDARYFYTLFKKRTGQTTDQYRRSKSESP